MSFDEDEVNLDQEALCYEHIDEANHYTYCVFGCPAVLLILISLICLVVDIMGIAGAINDADFTPVREAYYDTDGKEVVYVEPEVD